MSARDDSRDPRDPRLSAQRRALAAALAERLAAGDAPLPELRELQERIKLLDATIAEQGARKQHRIAALLWPVALVGLLLLVAASVPVPRVPLSLTLKASAVQLDLAEATQLGPLSVNADIHVEGFSTLESGDPALVTAASLARADSLSVQATESRLRALRLPAGASLGVEARRDAVALLVDSALAPVIAELELRGAATLRVGDAPEPLARNYPRSEWLRLVAGDAAKPAQTPPPMTLSLDRRRDADDEKAPLQLSALKPTRLRFVERREGAVGDSSALVTSSLLGGTLSLPATGQTLALAAGDGLELDGLRIERFEIIAGTPLRVELNGSARGLRQRVGEFERSLKPSWLEYVSRHHLTKLLWASAAVLWGALAWLRRQFGAVRP